MWASDGPDDDMKETEEVACGPLQIKSLSLIHISITTVLVLVIVALTSRGVDIWRWVLQDVRTTTLARTAMDTTSPACRTNFA